VFDAVLIFKGYEDLVREHRPVSEDALNDPVRRLGKPTKTSVYAPFSFRQIAEFIILLPVNFVPYVGVPLFLLLTGYRAGPFQHWRYFQLLGYGGKQRSAFVGRRRWQYTWYYRTPSLYVQRLTRCIGTVPFTSSCSSCPLLACSFS
jgi:hypothetical protein